MRAPARREQVSRRARRQRLTFLQHPRQVQVAGARAKQPGFGHEVGRSLQRQAHTERRQPGVRVNQQCHRAAHDRRRLAGAAERHVGRAAGAGKAVGTDGRERRTLDASRGDLAAGRRQVGLYDVVDGRRAARTPGRERVVAASRRAVGAHRTHRDDVGRVAGGGHAAEHRLAVGRFAAIAGRGHHHDARAHRALHCLAEGVVAVGLRHLRAERHVDHADVVLAAMFDGPVDRFYHVGHLARAVVAEHAQVDEMGARGHAAGRVHPPRADLGAGHDARDVRAMTVSVAAAAAVASEVHACHHFSVQRTVRRDARVDDGHAHARATHRSQRADQTREGRIGTRRGGGQRHMRRHHRIGSHRAHIGVARERVQLTGRHLEYRTPAQTLLQRQRVARQHAADRGVVAIDDHLDGAAIAVADLVIQIRRQARAAPLSGAGRAWRGDDEGND